MSDRVGAIINKDIEVVKGRIGSFINNFMASANGCKMPYGPTMLGPFRSCMYPKILRSTNVRKAMAIRMGTWEDTFEEEFQTANRVTQYQKDERRWSGV